MGLTFELLQSISKQSGRLLLWISLVGIHSLNAQIKTTDNSFNACAPWTIKFYTQNPKAATDTWNLYDAAGVLLIKSGLDTLTYNFIDPDSYTVTIGAFSQVITIYPNLVPQFTTSSPTKGCIPFTVNLNDATTVGPGITITGFNWSFSDGGSSTGKNTSYTFTNYEGLSFVNVSLVVSPASCNKTMNFSNYFDILKKPIAVAVADKNYRCMPPLTCNFNSQSTASPLQTLTYEWTGAAGVGTNSFYGPVTYNAAGNYQVILKVTNQNGCWDADTVPISVEPLDLNFTRKDTICLYERDTLRFLNHSNDYFYSASSPHLIYNPLNNNVWEIFKNTNVVSNGMYSMTITKKSISDPSCQVSKTISYYLFIDTPSYLLKLSKNCSNVLKDTVHARGISATVDSVAIVGAYRNKYGEALYIDSFKFSPKKDSIKHFNVSTYNPDSFYRQGSIQVRFDVAIKGKNDGCRFDTTAKLLRNEIFYSYITPDKLKGCAPLSVRIKTRTYAAHLFDSVTYYITPGNSIFKYKMGTNVDSHIFNHVFTSPGKYRVVAITRSQEGCIDTTNPLNFTVGDSIIPTFSVDNSNPCASDIITFSKTGTSSYDFLYFVSPDGRSLNCSNQTSIQWKQFETTGIQTFYLYGVKDGCKTKGRLDINVSGPKFDLNFDYKCSKRDSIYYFLTNISDVNPSKYTWTLGDGITTYTDVPNTAYWHQYITDSAYYTAKVTATNSNGCKFTDSTRRWFGKVKADYSRTRFCRDTSVAYPYSLIPNLSRRAGYLCNYAYTWQMDWNGITYPPITHTQPSVKFPHDTVNLSLIARDVNGCEDAITKRVTIGGPIASFTMKKPLCYPADSLRVTNTTSPDFPVLNSYYSISEYRRFPNGSVNLVPLYTNTTNPNIIKLIDSVHNSRRYLITMTNTYMDLTCPHQTIEDSFRFYKFDGVLLASDSICQNSSDQIKFSNNQIDSIAYRWKVDHILQPNPDSFYSMKKQLTMLASYQIQATRKHRYFGCEDTTKRQVTVAPKPKVMIDNSFDRTDGCTPITTVTSTDTLPINPAQLRITYTQVGRTTTYINNPSTIPFVKKRDTIYSIIRTTYGCYDSIMIANISRSPDFKLKTDKLAICKGDSITFKLDSMDDVDTLSLTFGDGNSLGRGNMLSFTQFRAGYRYHKGMVLTDSIRVSVIGAGPGGVCPKGYTFPYPIRIYDPISRITVNNGIDTAYCFGPVNFNNLSTGADSFRWVLSNGFSDTSKHILDYNFLKPGKYQAKLYAISKALNCPDSSIRNLELYPLPHLSATLDTVCLGDSLVIRYSDTLNRTRVFLYPDSIARNPYLRSPIKVMIREPQTLTMISRSDKNCTDTISVAAYVVKPLQLRSLDTIVVSGSRVGFPVFYDPLWKYTWTPPLNEPSCWPCSEPIMQFIKLGEHSLLAEDKFGCFKRSSQYRVDVFPDILVRVPTAFSPNGDNNNDIIYARGSGIKKLLSFKIYNRLGQLLFMTDDERFGWDGKYHGVTQNTDVYYYTYEAEAYIPGKKVSGEGNFMLMK